MNLYQKIIEQICLAQIYNSAAHRSNSSYRATEMYSKKASAVNKAKALILHNPKCGILYKGGDDARGKFVDYFQFSIYGQERQFSFHTGRLEGNRCGVDHIEWDGVHDRYTHPQQCMKIIKQLKLTSCIKSIEEVREIEPTFWIWK